MTTKDSKCDIAFIALAAESAYRVKKGNKIDPNYSSVYQDTLLRFEQNGYTMKHAIAPKSSGGSGTSPLAALCLAPNDDKKPIIISFRGTKALGDIVSDIRIGINGVAERKFRDAAYNYYLNIRQQYPGREIIITGHSLGGFLAQYVGTRAYHQGVESSDQGLLHVRTFNTAPIGSSHGVVLQNHPELTGKFVNYRLESDVVSKLPLQNYYGNTLIFPSKKNFKSAHSMKSLVKELPEHVKNQVVGYDSNTQSTSVQNALVELSKGMLYSYQCRVSGQYFSRFRAGPSNLALMQEYLPEIIKLMENKDYDNAIIQLGYLKNVLKGDVSTGLIDQLIHRTIAVKKEQIEQQEEMKHDLLSKVPVEVRLAYIQTALVNLTDQVLFSYKALVQDQYLSRFRVGRDNLAMLNEHLPEISKLMQQDDYDKALIQLSELKTQLKGDIAPSLIDQLIMHTHNTKLEQSLIKEEQSASKLTKPLEQSVLSEYVQQKQTLDGAAAAPKLAKAMDQSAVLRYAEQHQEMKSILKDFKVLPTIPEEESDLVNRSQSTP